MGAVRIIILVVAAVFAVGLALVFRGLAGHKAPPPPVVAQAPGQPMAQVLVARRDLAPGVRVAQGDLGWQPWPVDSLNPAFITDGRAPAPAPHTPVDQAQAGASRAVADAAATVVGGPMEQHYGDIVREPILANEPITAAKLVRGGDGGYMAVVLHPGMQAMAVPISSVTAAGGFILPGDRVDVLHATAPTPGVAGEGGPEAQVLLRNVRVLAIDQTVQQPKSGQTMVGNVATLEVAADDAELLARVTGQTQGQGNVILSLRAYADAGGPSGRGVDDADGGVVRILRGDKSSEVTVNP
jgi:pilus assembly protein CpaB